MTTDHHFLAVGEGLFLFDPTAGQFDGPITVDRYFVADGSPFVQWRVQKFSDHG